jgi:glycosyltransferase involved in cell wall biosynthesis
VHFVLLGNKGNVAEPYQKMLEGTAAQGLVTFGGYREDTVEILQSAYLGVIATTGWDSFPVSGMEMASAGLPMLVSKLQGLPEMVDAGSTGEVFPPGDHIALADNIERFLNDPERRSQYSRAARARIEGFFTQQHVTERISRAVSEVWSERP